jgi:hypothetical protein
VSGDRVYRPISRYGRSPLGHKTAINPFTCLCNRVPRSWRSRPVWAAPASEASRPAPLNYLEIYYEDFTYAASHGNAPFETCSPVDISAQDELNTASTNLLGISEP